MVYMWIEVYKINNIPLTFRSSKQQEIAITGSSKCPINEARRAVNFGAHDMDEEIASSNVRLPHA